MTGGRWPASSKKRGRLTRRRVQAATIAVWLLVAVGTAACSPSSAPPGISLPITVQTSSHYGVHPSKCTLNASDTEVTANGTFNPAYSLHTDTFGQRETPALQLNVLSSHKVDGIDVSTGSTDADISVGETSWHLVAAVQGFRPTRCIVDLVPLP